MSVDSIGYSDWRNSREIKNGMVIATFPSDHPVPESWWLTMNSVKCGYYSRSSLSTTVKGCGVEISYRSGSPAPSVCEICGGTDLRSYGVYGLMGFGEKPPMYGYRFPYPVFGTHRNIVDNLIARRRHVGEAAGARITASLNGLLAIWKVTGLQPKKKRVPA